MNPISSESTRCSLTAREENIREILEMKSYPENFSSMELSKIREIFHQIVGCVSRYLNSNDIKLSKKKVNKFVAKIRLQVGEMDVVDIARIVNSINILSINCFSSLKSVFPKDPPFNGLNPLGFNKKWKIPLFLSEEAQKNHDELNYRIVIDSILQFLEKKNTENEDEFCLSAAFSSGLNNYEKIKDVLLPKLQEGHFIESIQLVQHITTVKIQEDLLDLISLYLQENGRIAESLEVAFMTKNSEIRENRAKSIGMFNLKRVCPVASKDLVSFREKSK